MKALQLFTEERLEQDKNLSPTQIAQFLEDFRLMHAGASKSKLISIKIPENVLAVFRGRCEQLGVPYQTQIKKLMKEWL